MGEKIFKIKMKVQVLVYIKDKKTSLKKMMSCLQRTRFQRHCQGEPEANVYCSTQYRTSIFTGLNLYTLNGMGRVSKDVFLAREG